MLCDVNVLKVLHFEVSYCDVLTFCDVYVLKLLRFETITFSDATLSDINVA